MLLGFFIITLIDKYISKNEHYYLEYTLKTMETIKTITLEAMSRMFVLRVVLLVVIFVVEISLRECSSQCSVAWLGLSWGTLCLSIVALVILASIYLVCLCTEFLGLLVHRLQFFARVLFARRAYGATVPQSANRSAVSKRVNWTVFRELCSSLLLALIIGATCCSLVGVRPVFIPVCSVLIAVVTPEVSAASLNAAATPSLAATCLKFIGRTFSCFIGWIESIYRCFVQAVAYRLSLFWKKRRRVHFATEDSLISVRLIRHWKDLSYAEWLSRYHPRAALGTRSTEGQFEQEFELFRCHDAYDEDVYFAYRADTDFTLLEDTFFVDEKGVKRHPAHWEEFQNVTFLRLVQDDEQLVPGFSSWGEYERYLLAYGKFYKNVVQRSTEDGESDDIDINDGEVEGENFSSDDDGDEEDEQGELLPPSPPRRERKVKPYGPPNRTRPYLKRACKENVVYTC